MTGRLPFFFYIVLALTSFSVRASQEACAGAILLQSQTVNFFRPNSLKFRDASQRIIPAQQLRFILDTDDSKNPLSVVRGDSVYPFEFSLDLVRRVIRFVERDAETAFSLPMDHFDQRTFTRAGLHPCLHIQGWVAREFRGTPFEHVLLTAASTTSVRRLNRKLEREVLKNMNGTRKPLSNPSRFVNGDPHVNFEVYLTEKNGDLIADMAGGPLRYRFSEADLGATFVDRVEDFVVPNPGTPEYDVFLLWQAAAVVRHIKENHPDNFQKLVQNAE